MKVKVVPSIICAGIGLLAGYGFYAANGSEWQKWLMFAVAAVEFIVLLCGGFCIKYAERGGGNITALSAVFTIIALILQLVFSLVSFNAAPYIVLNGILVLLFIGITYAIAKSLN